MGSDKWAVVGRDALQQIEADRIREIGRSDINYFIDPPGWNVVEQLLRKVAMRVEKHEPSPRFDILYDQITQ